jgi:NADPH-dependent curcumin reductase CurA
MGATTSTNRRVVLTRLVEGVPRPVDFRVSEVPLAEPAAGEFLVRHIYLSLDPYQRSVIAGRHRGSSGPMQAGDMPPAETIGQVVKSRHQAFREGDYVRHPGGWQTHSLSDGSGATHVDPRRAPLSAYLGVLGMPGLTAWASAVKLAEIAAGQTALVSAAAGPVGATFGQIAMLRGARAVGIAGSDEKCRLVTGRLGFSACVNRRSAAFRDELRAAVGEGAHCYHDNVGAALLGEVMEVLRPYGTVVLCGLMAEYNVPPAERSFRFNLGTVILKRAVMKGLVVNDFEPQRAEFFDEVSTAIAAGKVRFLEDRVSGIDNAGAHFACLMRGENVGKTLVVLGPE